MDCTNEQTTKMLEKNSQKCTEEVLSRSLTETSHRERLIKFKKNINVTMRYVT